MQTLIKVVFSVDSNHRERLPKEQNASPYFYAQTTWQKMRCLRSSLLENGVRQASTNQSFHLTADAPETSFDNQQCHAGTAQLEDPV
jgi:hypothetical protein